MGAEQRISVLSALRAQTIDAAWQVFLESERGSIEAGKRADLVVLSQDPLNNPESLAGIRVDETIISGKTVFCRGGHRAGTI